MLENEKEIPEVSFTFIEEEEKSEEERKKEIEELLIKKRELLASIRAAESSISEQEPAKMNNDYPRNTR